MSTISEAIHNHHQEMSATLHEYVAGIAEAPAGGDAQGLIAFLKNDLLPHAAGEEAYLYPAVDPLVKEYGRPTATMTVDHEHIKEYITQIEEAAQALEAAAPETRLTRQATLRRLCWQLEALLSVHLDKEERVYLPLFEEYVAPAVQQQILDGMHEAPAAAVATSEPAVLDVRSIPPRGRHELIFATFAALAPDQTFVLVNDHDPKPLYYQFQAEHTDAFTWDYLERGPEVWRVRIGRTGRAASGGRGTGRA